MREQKKTTDTLAHSAVEIPGYTQVKTDNDRLPLPPDLPQTHPHIQLQVALRHISMLELLEWMYTEHRRIEDFELPYIELANKNAEAALQELRERSGNDAAFLLSVLNRAVYMCAHFMIEYPDQPENDSITLEGLGMIADYFKKLYQNNII